MPLKKQVGHVNETAKRPELMRRKTHRKWVTLQRRRNEQREPHCLPTDFDRNRKTGNQQKVSR